MPINPLSFYKEIEEEWQQGDIVKEVNYNTQKVNLAVLITPQCDIVHNKADFFLFVLSTDFKFSFLKIIDPKNKLSDDHIKGLLELSKNKLNEIISNIIHHFHGENSNRFYYLPSNYINASFDPSYIDFQRILSVPEETLNSWKNKRIATISDPFRSQILSRYLSYVGRIGTPEYSKEEVFQLFNIFGLQFRKEDFDEIYRKKL